MPSNPSEGPLSAERIAELCNAAEADRIKFGGILKRIAETALALADRHADGAREAEHRVCTPAVGVRAPSSAPVISKLETAVADALGDVMASREQIIRAFIAETGLLPSECEQIQQSTDTGVRWFVRKRSATQTPEPIGDAELRELEFGCDVQEREIQSLRAAGVDCATPHRVVTTKQLRRLLEIARENGLANVYYPKAVRAEREAKEQAHADLATARARVAELQALTDAAALLLGRTADSSENYEEKAAAFYTDTGFMAPGKDAPAAMGGQNQEQRRAAWQAWIETEIADWRDRYAALSPKNPRQGAEQVTDELLLLKARAWLSDWDGADLDAMHLAPLLREVRDATARECAELAVDHSKAGLASGYIARAIRARFNLPTPEPRE